MSEQVDQNSLNEGAQEELQMTSGDTVLELLKSAYNTLNGTPGKERDDIFEAIGAAMADISAVENRIVAMRDGNVFPSDSFGLY